VLLTKRGRMHLTRTSYGYEAVLTGVTGVVPANTPVTQSVAARPAAQPAVKAQPAVVNAAANGPNVLQKLSYFAFPGGQDRAPSGDHEASRGTLGLSC